MLADRFAREDRPVKGDLEHGWPAEIVQRVLGNWHTYGYRSQSSKVAAIRAGPEITLGDQHSYLPTTSRPDGRDPTRLSNS
jgi:hypothetical protein